MKRLPISVQICTLNEEDNIHACIKLAQANNVAEIVVIDGGSTDTTRERARLLGVTVINAGRVGLARQRQKGIESTKQRYVAFVDADDRLTSDCMQKLLREMRLHNFEAIQADTRSLMGKSYWQTGWGLFAAPQTRKAIKTTMVGRPALYTTTALCDIGGMDFFFTFGSEDTDLSYRLQKARIKQGLGTGVAYRLFPSTYSQSWRKWLTYGRGYYRFAHRHPERKEAILKHLLRTIPFTRIRKKTDDWLKYLPFSLLYSFFCIIGYIYESWKIA